MKKKNTSSDNDAFILGVAIGVSIGILLSLILNDIVYYPLCLAIGIGFGTSISGESMDFKWSSLKDIKKLKKEDIGIDIDKELVIKSSLRKILLNSIITTFIIAIVIILSLTCFRDMLILILKSFESEEEVLEYVLFLLPLIYIIVVTVKYTIYVTGNSKKK